MTYAELIFNKYAGKRVLLDSNLLLLFLIGSFERSRIEVFKRTSQFTTSDFDSLAVLLTAFSSVVTTPHVLTEINSLANSLPEFLKSSWCEHFAHQTAGFLEVFEPAVSVMQGACFNPFGLTDAAIHHASENTLILTEDYRLSSFLTAQGVAILNFRDIAA